MLKGLLNWIGPQLAHAGRAFFWIAAGYFVAFPIWLAFDQLGNDPVIVTQVSMFREMIATAIVFGGGVFALTSVAWLRRGVGRDRDFHPAIVGLSAAALVATIYEFRGPMIDVVLTAFDRIGWLDSEGFAAQVLSWLALLTYISVPTLFAMIRVRWPEQKTRDITVAAGLVVSFLLVVVLMPSGPEFPEDASLGERVKWVEFHAPRHAAPVAKFLERLPLDEVVGEGRSFAPLEAPTFHDDGSVRAVGEWRVRGASGFGKCWLELWFDPETMKPITHAERPGDAVVGCYPDNERFEIRFDHRGEQVERRGEGASE